MYWWSDLYINYEMMAFINMCGNVPIIPLCGYGYHYHLLLCMVVKVVWCVVWLGAGLFCVVGCLH